MALTISNTDRKWSGSGFTINADVAFDSSYAFGGETLQAKTLGIDRLERVLIEPKAGLSFEYDYTHETIKAFAPAPPVVIEEQQTIASNTITLNYPPAYIMYVAQADANVAITDTAATLAANQCKPTAAFTWGARGSLTFHADLSGVVYVTYVTQAWKDVWDNLVQSEAVTVTTNVGVLANNACAFQSVRSVGSTSTNSCLFLDKDDTVATTEVDIDFSPAATNTSLTFAAADSVTSAVVTYIKLPSSGYLAENFVEEEAMSAASNVCTPAYPIAIWSYAGMGVENGAVTNRMINMLGSRGTNECYINFLDPYTKLTSDAMTTGTAAYVRGRHGNIPGLVPLEIKNATDLSWLTGVKVSFQGV